MSDSDNPVDQIEARLDVLLVTTRGDGNRPAPTGLSEQSSIGLVAV